MSTGRESVNAILQIFFIQLIYTRKTVLPNLSDYSRLLESLTERVALPAGSVPLKSTLPGVKSVVINRMGLMIILLIAAGQRMV